MAGVQVADAGQGTSREGSDDRWRSRGRLHLAAAGGLAAVAATALALNGTPSAQVHASLARWTSEAPTPVQHAVELVSEGGLVLLAVSFLVVALAAWRERRRRPTVVVAAGAVLAAYGLSELLKSVHEQPRPCAVMTAVRTVAECPPAGDWSLPSNHATIAAALATAVVVLAPRLWFAVVPVVLAVGVARVALGVHYPHDVVDGFSVGAGVVGLVAGAALVVRRARARRPGAAPPGRATDAPVG